MNMTNARMYINTVYTLTFLLYSEREYIIFGTAKLLNTNYYQLQKFVLELSVLFHTLLLRLVKHLDIKSINEYGKTL